ncbi:MAG: ATP-dependent RNA helicase HrpA, partial [Thiotrichaceae bacterium]|nr:ATP-dependent RNA helicase HrpA [Thiotrichaceae bacterium]
YDTIIIDEAHERSLNIDFLLGYLKKLLPKRPDLKVIITSATIDTERFSRFFANAPVIEVSGRTYPVEVRYRPLEEEGTMVDGILSAVDELSLETAGDILVFLSGEREIRESAEALRKYHPAGGGVRPHLEILPLYARLSPAEQSRIFSRHSEQRIILATNVAETSLTVPGIRYVIDTGLVRISRYSVRHKIQRLPIEKVSQASARQRSGRCGRMSDGIAIRLYSEEDHEQRPGYTEPELLRTNLAQVILQMLSLRLGDIKEFPFLEKPSAKQINDGFLLLEQLGAINPSRQLTSIGRSLSKLSVDPRIGRVIIAGEQHNVLSEVLIIASALSCQEPRERPADKQQAADEKYAQYASKKSDFISFLNLWVSYEAQRKHLSQNKLRKYCQTHFLSFMRMREWRELYQQLYTQTRELGFRFNDFCTFNTENNNDDDTLDYASIHQALLTGFLGNIGFKEEKNTYLGARNIRFGIFPGSHLYKRKPKWLMAAEIVETSAIYARTVAAIEPLWLEQQAQHLLKHHYYEPFWEAKSGQVSAWSKVSLYGLVINAKKKVNYGPIDPEVSQEIFIRDALVTGEYKDQSRNTPRFIKYNLALINELEHLEHKSRRKDLLVDDLAIFEFYQQRIEHALPSGFIYTRASFEQWRRNIEKKEADYLYLKQSDLLKKDAEHISDELYPSHIISGELQLPLEYHFLPGHALDGVTVAFPLAVINQLDEQLFDWLVPGLIREKITLLLRALPKVIRKQLVPVPDTVTAFLEQKKYRQGKLTGQLLDFLKSRLSYTLFNELEHQMGRDAHTESALQVNIPEHLKMNFKIIDKEGHELDSSRHLSRLKQLWGEQALEQLDESVDESIEREGIVSWDFESLPDQLLVERHRMTMTLYPALQDRYENVAIKLYDQQKIASCNHGQGIFRLLNLMLSKELNSIKKHLPDIDKMCLLYAPYGSCSDLSQDIVTGILLSAVRESVAKNENGELKINFIREQNSFNELLNSVKQKLEHDKMDVSQTVLNVLQASQMLTKQLKENIPFNLVNTLADIKNQKSHLIYKGFVAQTPLVWLKRLPRYFKGMSARLEKAKSDYRRDGLNQAQIKPLWEKYEKHYALLKNEKMMPDKLYFAELPLEEYRWLIEELRISLFAQELKTSRPVSVKRLEKKWQELLSSA